MGNSNEKAQRPLSYPSGMPRSKDLDNGAGQSDMSELNNIVEQASYRDADSILRQTLRGVETEGDADARDVAGATDFDDTPRGREETKNDKAGARNQNG